MARPATSVRSGAEAVSHQGIRSVWGHLLPLTAGALLLGLAFPRPGWGWLGHVALVPAAVVALRTANLRRFIWCAALVFLGWWAIKLGWLLPVTAGGYPLLAAYMMAHWVAALLVLRWLDRRYRSAAVLGLPLAWVSLELVRGYFPAGGFGWFMLGHTQAPYAPGHGAGWLIQVADLFGVYGVSFLVAMTNGLLVDALSRPLVRQDAAGRSRPARALAVGGAVWLVALIGALIYGQYRVGQHATVTTPGPRLAVVQTNVPQSNKQRPTRQQEIDQWSDMRALTQQAANAQPAPDLIVWPETMVPGGLNPAARRERRRGGGQAVYHQAIQQVARTLNVPLLVGANAYHEFESMTLSGGRSARIPQRKHNSVFLYDADGEQAGTWYDKVHLVPFGEYVPWVGAVPALKDFFISFLTPYDFDYTLNAGDRFTVFELSYRALHEAGAQSDKMDGSPRRSGANGRQAAEKPTPRDRTRSGSALSGRPATQPGATRPAAQSEAAAFRFATPICFEDAVARVCRAMVYGGDARAGPDDAARAKRVDALVNLTNDGWFAGGAMRRQHVQIAVFRAIENRVPMARSVNTGISGFIDSVGRVGPVVTRDGAAQRVAGVASKRLRLDARQTVFGTLGAMPAGIVALVTLALVLVGALRRDKIGPPDDAIGRCVAAR